MIANIVGVDGQDNTRVAQQEALIALAQSYALEGNDELAWKTTLEAADVWGVEVPYEYFYPFDVVGNYYIESDFVAMYGKKNYAMLEKYITYLIELYSEQSQDFDTATYEYWCDLHVYLANALKMQGLIMSAKVAYEQAYDGYNLLKAQNVEFDQGWVLENIYIPLANIYTRLENYESASAILSHVMIQFSELKLSEQEAEAAINYGILQSTIGHTDEAIQLFTDYEHIVNSPKLKAMIFQNRARCYLELGHLAEAERDIQKAVQIFLTCDQDPHILFDTYHTLSKIEIEKSHYEKAKQYIEQSLQYAEVVFPKRSRQIGKITITQGNIYLRQAKFELALECFQRALYCVLLDFEPIDNHQLPSLSQLYAENTILEALDGKIEAYEKLYAESNDTRMLRYALDHYLMAFDTEELISRFQVQDDSKLQFQNTNKLRRENALHLCAQMINDQPELAKIAFDIIEGSKASILFSAIQRHRLAQDGSIDKKIIQDIQAYEKALYLIDAKIQTVDAASEKKELEALAQEKVEVLQSLRASKERLRPQKTSAYWSKKNLLDVVLDSVVVHDNDALLEYFVGEKAVFGFAIMKNKDIQFFSIPHDSVFMQVTENYMSHFSAKNRWNIGPKSYEQAAYYFYAHIVAPAKIEDAKNVILIPDGELSALPFEALLTQKYIGASFKNMPYWLNDANIKYAYSAAILLAQQKKVYPPKELLLIAPEFKNHPFLPPLDDASLLIEGMNRIHQIRGDIATKEAFLNQAPSFSLIHLYTHADAGNEDASPQIFFADTSMSLQEIYTLTLQADLVILSACETNLGKFEKGEGVMSLARGFTYAGANSLISSLWQVKNKQTAELFTRFYQNWEGVHSSKSQALRQAKLDYIASSKEIYATPAYWAGFVYLGRDNVAPSFFSWPYMAVVIIGGLLLWVIVQEMRKRRFFE